MVGGPLQNKRHRVAGECPAQHRQISQVEDGFMFSVERMEVRRIMIPPEHLNYDTIEDADRRHNR